MANLHNRRRYISVEVEIDLSDIDTEDLLSELKSRDVQAHTPSVDIQEIYKQFAFGNKSQAVMLTKQYIENAIGRILP